MSEVACPTCNRTVHVGDLVECAGCRRTCCTTCAEEVEGVSAVGKPTRWVWFYCPTCEAEADDDDE